MNLKVGKHVYPVKGLITSLGATLLLISMAIDFSYGKMAYLMRLFLRGRVQVIQMRAPKTAAYYISPIEIGPL